MKLRPCYLIQTFFFNSTAFFPEQSTKSPRTTPIGAVDNNNFANFDLFSSTTTIQSTTNTNKSTNNNNNDNFFDAFNDNFNANQKSTFTDFSNIDAFGDFSSTITKSSGYKVFDENDNGFEDDFFKLKLNDNSVNSSKSFSPTKKSSQTFENVSDKIPVKFADDYSKTEGFDSDLAEALKRSIAEKWLENTFWTKKILVEFTESFTKLHVAFPFYLYFFLVFITNRTQ